MLKHSESFPDPNIVHVELVKNQCGEVLFPLISMIKRLPSSGKEST